MKTLLRAAFVVFIEAVTIPIKFLIIVCCLLYSVIQSGRGILTLKECWESFIEGAKKGFKINWHWVKTGDFYYEEEES